MEHNNGLRDTGFLLGGWDGGEQVGLRWHYTWYFLCWVLARSVIVLFLVPCCMLCMYEYTYVRVYLHIFSCM